MSIDSAISRRGFLRLGVLTGVSATILPHLHQAEAQETSAEICNCDKPKTPAAALAALIEGNRRWADQEQIHPREGEAIRECFARGNPQTPFATILACVDSRVPPELVFDQGLGDLLTARVAGNSAVPITQDSLRYGAHNLGASIVFVLGHSDCGAMKAAVASFDPEGHRKGRFAFEPPLYPAVAAARKIVSDPDNAKEVLPVATNLHVILTVQQLASSEPFKGLIHQGKLLVKGGRYDIATQKVKILI